MELEARDLARIRKARRAVNIRRWSTPLVMAFFVGWLWIERYTSLLEDDPLLFILLPLALLTLQNPEVRGAPSYEQLLQILERGTAEPPDPIIEALADRT